MTKPYQAALTDTLYMEFPFRMTPKGAATATRARHVKDQIEQVLFTDPGERVFRPEFGAGVRRLVFEPNSLSLAALVQQRLLASLSNALAGEVDPRSLDILVEQDPAHPARLNITIEYRLAVIDAQQSYQTQVGI